MHAGRALDELRSIAEVRMSVHWVSQHRRDDADFAASMTFEELAGLLHVPLPAHTRLAGARFGLQRSKPGDVLYRSGDPFESLYVIVSGLLKLVAVDDGGCEQVFGFALSGEAVGMDGLHSGRHRVDATALEAVELALIPLAGLERLADLAGERELGEQLVHRILVQAMVLDMSLLCRLETLDGRSRVAAFLLSLEKRFGRVRSAPRPLELSMTAAEIGSYLRLPQEAVGDVLRELVEAGLIRACGRTISLASLAGLAGLVEQGRRAPLSDAA